MGVDLAMSDHVIGIDLTQSSKPSTLALLSITVAPVLVRVEDLAEDEEIQEFILTMAPKLVAIDSPLFLPSGMCCLEYACSCQATSDRKGRACERVLSIMGIGSYYTTKKSIIKRMIYRALVLKAWCERQSIPVIEIYPHATRKLLFGDLPKKSTPKGIEATRDYLSNIIHGMRKAKTHDHLDAVLAAYTGFLHLSGRADGIGDPDEGLLWVPKTKGD